MGLYALLDNTNTVTNIVQWDGATEWTPPNNLTAQACDVTVIIGATYSGGVFTNPVEPPVTPSAQSQATLALLQGIALTSTSTPTLNGTYSCSPQSISNVANITVYILRNNTFPGGLSQLPWADASGNVHVFPSITEFNDFATAFANFVAACQIYSDTNGSVGSIPSNAITIP